MRYLRFRYIVPRVILLILLLLATEVGSGYLIQYCLVAGGEASVSAKVDIGPVKASLLDTRVLIQDVAVANPRSPMKNLVAAERVEIDFNANALLRKKLIADYGIISGLEFSSPRETSGELPEVEVSPEEEAAESWVTPVTKEYTDGWLNGLETRFSSDLEQQLESVRLAKELTTRWPQKYRDLEAKAKLIKADAKKLEQDVKTAKANPLRHVDFLAQVPQQVNQLKIKLKEVQDELKTLPAQLKSDKAKVQTARKNDEKFIREQISMGNVDAKSLSNYLLGEKITSPLNEVIAWVRWAREVIPPRQRVVRPPAARGEDIFFAGCQQLPDMLVKAVRLDGRARLNGHPVELVGVVRDFTTQPALHNKPTTIEFTAKGGLPLTLQATLDRTQDTPRDHVHCETSDLLMPDLSLGKQGKLHLAVAPTRASVTMDLLLVGDRLEGNVSVVQQGIAITPTIGGGALGERLQAAISNNVSQINQATTNIALTGTLKRPNFDFSSTLGTSLAEAINRSASDVLATERDRLLAKGQAEMDKHMAKLNSEVAELETKLVGELKVPGDVVASLLGQQGQTQLGQSPFGQLFK